MFRLINSLKNKKGFTLIELIVVLAVLAVIMAIAVPRFLGVQEDAKKEADASTAAMIAKAAELYLVTENIDLPAADSTTLVDIDDLTDDGKYVNSDINYQYYITTSGGVEITITPEGTAEVEFGGDLLYPRPSGDLPD
jgi:type IV pilus assembly protein PilA